MLVWFEPSAEDLLHHVAVLKNVPTATGLIRVRKVEPHIPGILLLPSAAIRQPLSVLESAVIRRTRIAVLLPPSVVLETPSAAPRFVLASLDGTGRNPFSASR
jgi:hypothetical protein